MVGRMNDRKRVWSEERTDGRGKGASGERSAGEGMVGGKGWQEERMIGE
jgi:hypothetical protein